MTDEKAKPEARISPADTAQLQGEVEKVITPSLKTFMDENTEFIEQVDEILKSDPAAREDFEEMFKGEQTNEKLAAQVSSLSSMIMTMQLDPEIQRDSAQNYDFPHERVAPRLLRRAGNNSAARMIKQYRFYQLEDFSGVSDGKSPGFQLGFVDTDRKATDAERKAIAKAEKILADEFFYVPNEEKPNLGKFMRYAYQDFFDIDKIAIEIIRTNASSNKKKNYRGTPLGLMLVDAGTIFHIVPKVDRIHGAVDTYRWDKTTYDETLGRSGTKFYFRDEYRYIQVDRTGERRAVYTEESMILSHAFGGTDIREQFQGYSIVEQALDILRYIIDSIIYNATRRSTGTMPKGMITIEGATEDGWSREEMEQFRKLIWGLSSGRADKWKYPVLGTPKGVKPTFTKFHESSREMEDFLWLATLVSVLCSFAGMDPENIGLASQKNTLGKARLFDKRDEEGANVRSNDSGFRFFLSYLKKIVGRVDVIEELTGVEGLEWKWIGLDVEDETKKLTLDKLALETSASVNDLLVAQDKPKAKFMIGDINLYDLPAIGNQAIQAIISGELQAQQAEQYANELDGDEEGSPTDNQDANKSTVTVRLK